MKSHPTRYSALVLLAICISSDVFAEGKAKGDTISLTSPIQIEGPEQSHLDFTRPDAGLAPALGVESFEVFRAVKERPELSDGKGWTYHHHVDLAAWKGRLYVAWDACEKDEDTWPSRELYSTSADGAAWAPPAELFPQGISTPLRMYFFHAPNGRMLVIAGLRLSEEKTTEKGKGPLVVREIRSDHTFGPVLTLRAPQAPVANQPPKFDQVQDSGFVEACRQLLANHTYLEQQDFGLLLDAPDRLTWYNPDAWTNPAYDKNTRSDFGRALSFFHRQDGALVGIAKKGFVTVSANEGRTWSEPVIPPSLVTGNGKVWGQHTADDRYALAYDPDKKNRFPLVIVTGDDGVTFRDMRVVHGELPVLRYPGRAKSLGPSYVRGISEWSNDGSWKDNALWLVYSSHKEDIWVSRVPVPVGAAEATPVTDDFESLPIAPRAEGWNTYSPKWAPVSVAEDPTAKSKCLQIEDRDPYDHARAVRLFPETRKVRVSFDLYAAQDNRGMLEVRLVSFEGSAAPVGISFMPDGKICALGAAGMQPVELGSYTPNTWLQIQMEADCERRTFSVSLSGQRAKGEIDFAENAKTLQRLSFRSVSRPDLISVKSPIPPESDQPAEPVTYRVDNVRIESLR